MKIQFSISIDRKFDFKGNWRCDQLAKVKFVKQLKRLDNIVGWKVAWKWKIRSCFLRDKPEWFYFLRGSPLLIFLRKHYHSRLSLRKGIAKTTFQLDCPVILLYLVVQRNRWNSQIRNRMLLKQPIEFVQPVFHLFHVFCFCCWPRWIVSSDSFLLFSVSSRHNWQLGTETHSCSFFQSQGSDSSSCSSVCETWTLHLQHHSCVLVFLSVPKPQV